MKSLKSAGFSIISLGATLVCHRVLIGFDRIDMLDIIQTKLDTSNKPVKLKMVGTPYWLTSEEKRQSGQRATSLVIAFRTEEDANRAKRNRICLGSVTVRVEKLHAVLPTTQCNNCSSFGHIQQRCPKPSTCKFSLVV